MSLERVYRTAELGSLDRSLVPPGSMIVAADLAGALLRVSAEAKALRLHGVTVKIDPDKPGCASFFTPDSAILKPGDLVFASGSGWSPESYTEPRASRGVCGVVASIDEGMVRMTSVVRGLRDGVHDLSVRFFPRLHASSTGMTVAGSHTLSRVGGAATWRQFDRVSGSGIPLGAYITDPVPIGATRLRISKPATSTSAWPIRLYDADVERFGDPVDAWARCAIEAPSAPRRAIAPACEGRRRSERGARGARSGDQRGALFFGFRERRLEVDWGTTGGLGGSAAGSGASGARGGLRCLGREGGGLRRGRAGSGAAAAGSGSGATSAGAGGAEGAAEASGLAPRGAVAASMVG